jgi:TetR/AcrR family transcriptional regulator, ethionamide resistance regulator
MAIREAAVTSSSPAGTSRRRRRSPAEARQEILDAAGALLEEVRADEATVAAIMAKTTLSRKSFYVYFNDRAEMLASLVEPLRIDAQKTLAQWREAEDTVGAGRAALYSAALVYQHHGALLRALSEASQQDPEAARVWRAINDPVIEVAAQKIEEATAAGESKGLDAQATAMALVTMNVHFLLERLAGQPQADLESTVQTLTTIWERTIYQRDMPANPRPPGRNDARRG